MASSSSHESRVVETHNDIPSDNTEPDDWVLLPSDDEYDDPSTQRPKGNSSRSGFQFQFHLEVAGRRYNYVRGRDFHHHHHEGNQPPSTTIPSAPLEKPSLVATQEQSLLFRLPLEVRLRIYGHLLQLPYNSAFGVRMTHVSTLMAMAFSPKPPTVLSILATCRKALCEAEHILYADNWLWPNSLNFVQSLGPGRRSAVSTLTMTVQSPGAALDVLKGVQTLPNLRILRLVRQLSVDYIDIASWNIMRRQLVAEAEKLIQLEDLRIVTPRSNDDRPHITERRQRLDEIDKQVIQAALNRKT